MDTKFYSFFKPIVGFLVKFLYRPKAIGLENIPKDGPVVLAGNHTKWLDPPSLVTFCKRQVHFLTKIELFSGKTGWFVKGMGCIPVNRKIHDKNALSSAEEFLNNNLCVGIFPEGTINRTNDIIMPFKIGAVKSSHDTNSLLVPFVITGKYRIIGKSVRIEFLKPIHIGTDLNKENDKLMEIIKEKLSVFSII